VRQQLDVVNIVAERAAEVRKELAELHRTGRECRRALTEYAVGTDGLRRGLAAL
jgi:hypothetical protein